MNTNTSTKQAFLTTSLCAAILIAVDRHLTIRRLERTQSRREAAMAAHALALGAQLATEGRITT